jgi:hypothetical protein
VVEYLRVFCHVGFFRFDRSSRRMSDAQFARNRRGFHVRVKEKTIRKAKALLGATVFLDVLIMAMLTDSGSTTTAGDKKAGVSSHWRHHDGHWSYWHEGDQRWYYTDGSNWFYQDDDAWNVYGFDKGFGKDGFGRGEYKVRRAPGSWPVVAVLFFLYEYGTVFEKWSAFADRIRRGAAKLTLI